MADGPPRLALVGELETAVTTTSALPADGAASPAAPKVAEPPPAKATPPESAPVCLSYGPFASEAAATDGIARLRRAGASASLRRVELSPARGYNVFLPPLADRAAALAMAERLRAAGFNDLVVLNEGGQINAIALGRFGGEENARRHQTALLAKGFAARVAPAGAGAAQFWLDVRAPAGFDAAGQRRAIGAPRRQARRC
ncbi:hypothetical protein EBB59_05800 [Lysobacter pythonis]|uniref:SPOR domain-containing protein n=1 Tax=Solilutibacter pythonis TaxID=2483112 RepID=A0A3M2I149_9GAMM|nr:hypothetical protein EBB59_05800 [Lysobacter pythonis]